MEPQDARAEPGDLEEIALDNVDADVDVDGEDRDHGRAEEDRDGNNEHDEEDQDHDQDHVQVQDGGRKPAPQGAARAGETTAEPPAAPESDERKRGEQKRPPSPSASSVTSTATAGTVRAAACSDPSLNDALLQLQLLLTAHVGRMYGLVWPSEAVARKLVEAGFSAQRVVALRKVSQPDIERGLDQVLQYLAILLKDRTGTVVPMCRVLLRVRDQAIVMDPEKPKSRHLLQKQMQPKNQDVTSETGLAMEGILFSTLNELLAGISAATVVEALDARGEAVVEKFVDIVYAHFAKHHKTAPPESLEPCVALIGRLSWFCLPRTLDNFARKMAKVYFNSSALEYVPFMRVLSRRVKYSLVRTPACRRACLSFVQTVAKLLKTTSCAELIEETFLCVVFMLGRFRREHKPQRLPKRASSSASSVASASSANSASAAETSDADFAAAFDIIFGYACGYASSGKYLPSSLNAMESLVSWQALQRPVATQVPSQHERLCAELLRRIRNPDSRISGLDHLQRYLKGLLPLTSVPGPQPLAQVPEALFVDSAVPRAQEAALISAVMVELARCFPRVFDETMARGLTSTKTTTAQRAICLNALSKVAPTVPQGSASPLRGYAKFVVNLSGRDSPVGTVTEALACYPMLGEQSQQMLQNCVDCAFGFDFALVDAGRDALIRFCQLGHIYAEKAVMVTVESPSLKLVCTMQHTKAPQDTAQISSSVTTLERILCAALDKGFESPDLVAEAGASLLLASTYPDERVQAKARHALDRIGAISDKQGESQYLQRALDKLLLGLLGASGSADSCGGARVQALNKRLARKPGYCDFVAWWRNQCTLICAATLPHSNKPPFVRSLVHEYLTASSNRLQNAALLSLSHLKDCHEVLEKQLAMQSLQARNETFNGTFIKLMAALRDSYRGGALERRVHQMVRSWVQSSGDEVARLHMSKWTPHVVEAAARLLRKFVLYGQLNSFPDPEVARDQAVFLIREWRSASESAPRLAAVSEAFVTLLDSGHLKTVDAQSFALKVLSSSAGSKRYQEFGLRALLRQNLEAMLKHYYEAVLRSFDPKRWAKEPPGAINIAGPASGGPDGQNPFMVRIASAVLYALDASVTNEHALAEGLRPQMALLVSLLFVHPIREMRELVAGWVPRSAFLGLPHADFSPALVSSKLSGVERCVLVSRFLATHWESSSVDEIVQGAAKLSPYLSDEHVGCLLRIIEPWLTHCYPGATRQPSRLVTRLLRLCTRLRPGGDDPAWGIWQSVSLEEGLDETVRTIVDFVTGAEESEQQQRAALDAMSALLSRPSQLGNAPVDILAALVRALPALTWEAPSKEACLREADAVTAADAQKAVPTSLDLRSEADSRVARSVLRLVNHSPFMTRTFAGEDLARVLYFVFVEEGVDKALSQRTLRAINEEFAVGKPATLLHFEDDGAQEEADDAGQAQAQAQAALAAATATSAIGVAAGAGISLMRPRRGSDLDPGEVNSEGSGGDWLSTVAQHSEETMQSLAQTALHCVVYCQEAAKRTRAIMLLQNISSAALEGAFVRDLVMRVESRCMYVLKLLELGEGNAGTASRLEALEHLFILGEWIASSSSLEGRLREDLAILATCALSVPVVMRPNPFSRIRVSALKLLQSIGPARGEEAADPVLQDHLIGCLVHQQVAPLAAEIIMAQAPAPGSLEPATFVLLAAAIGLIQSVAEPTKVQAEKQRGLARHLVSLAESGAETRPEIGGLLDHLNARLLVLTEPRSVSVHTLTTSRRQSDASEGRESVLALSSSLATAESFVQSFVVALLRGSGNAGLGPATAGEASGVASEGFRVVLQFLVQMLEVGSDSWARGALQVLSECFKHREVVNLLLEQDSNLLETTMDGLVVALESWPRERRTDVLNVMAALRLKPDSSFDFIHAEAAALAAKQRCLIGGLAHCRAQLDANLH